MMWVHNVLDLLIDNKSMKSLNVALLFVHACKSHVTLHNLSLSLYGNLFANTLILTVLSKSYMYLMSDIVL